MSWSLCIDNIAKINNHLDEECKTLIGNKMDEMIKNSLFFQKEFCEQIKTKIDGIKHEGNDQCLDSSFHENKSLFCKLGKKYAHIIEKILEYKNGRSRALYDEMHKIAKKNNLCDESLDIIKQENATHNDDESTDSENEFEPYTPTINLFCPHSDCNDNDVFFDHESFKSHMSFDHGDERPYHCSECDLCYSMKGHLIEHIERIHQNKVKFTCNQCGKGFHSKTVWNDHCRVHRGIKYECNQCDQTFGIKSNLKNHIRSVHNNEKRYLCDFCNKGFYNKKDWRCHYRTHTGEKPFQCQTCDKTFKRKTALRRHTMIHTGERPYECSNCNKRFRRNYRRKTHQKECSK